MDVASIPLGSTFAKELDKAVSQCQVVLVINRTTWTSVTAVDGTRRLDNPDDFVRIEIESALARDIPVIPILLEGAIMPKRMQLPESLHELARRNGTKVGYDPDFHPHMNRLVKALKELLQSEESSPKSSVSQSAQVTTTLHNPSPRTNNPQETTDKLPEIIDIGNGVSLELVHIRGGKFLMGSPEGEGANNEKPQHEVTIPEFGMGKYPITQAQYEAVMGNNPSKFKGDNRPVEQVSWYKAVEFCKCLSSHTSREYRLATEAEWEYACRAGMTTPFHFGNRLTSEVAQCSSNFGMVIATLFVGQTFPVGNFPANGFGLYDMHGNVWEWCQDYWHDDYRGAPTNGSAWLTDNRKDTRRIKRGGSWENYPRHCRSAFRSSNSSGYRSYTLGFRVVCSAPRALQ